VVVKWLWRERVIRRGQWILLDDKSCCYIAMMMDFFGEMHGKIVVSETPAWHTNDIASLVHMSYTPSCTQRQADDSLCETSVSVS